MQHHGLATRLLDWSASIAIAAFFAVRESVHDHEDGVVWTLNPNAMNQLQLQTPNLLMPGDPHCDWACSLAFNRGDTSPYDASTRELLLRFSAAVVAMEPLETHARMVVQQSRFTVHGPSRAIERIENHSTFLRRIRIPAARKREFRSVLELV